MSISNVIRQTHRWVSVAFTIGVIVNTVVVMKKIEPPFWVYLLALVPLFMLLFTGLYLFVLPYAARMRSARRTS